MFRVLTAFTLVIVATSAVAPLRINGLVAATFTPFLANGTINTQAVEKQAAWLKKTGVGWVFVSGTTGESVKMTFAERKSQAELWVNIAPKYDIKVIVHVGTESTMEAIELAAHAQSIGANAIGAMPPVFFKPANVQALAATMSTIFKAAPSLPAYYYHIPSMTGVAFPMLDLIKAIEDVGTAPNFVGVKYTGLYTFPGFMDVDKILAYKQGAYEVLCGRDEMMIEALTAGVTGFVGSQYNFAGDLYNTIISTFHSGTSGGGLKEARKLQLDAVNVIGAWSTAPQGTDGCKNVMNVMDVVDVGDARLPTLPLSAAAAAALKVELTKACSPIQSIAAFCSASNTTQY